MTIKPSDILKTPQELQKELNVRMSAFLAKGGKVKILPPQKVDTNNIVRTKTAYTHGRMKMLFNEKLSGMGAYTFERKVS